MSGSGSGRTRVVPIVLGLAAAAGAWLVPALESAQARPATGSNAPHTGKSAPHTGKSAPHTGSSAPHTGKSAPHTGKSAPHTGSSAPPTQRRDTAPFWIDTPSGGRAIVYPPKSAGRQPLAVMLHGMCDVPENECPWLAPAVTPHAWLVCPRGSMACRGGGAMWNVSREKQTVESAVEGLVGARPGEVDSSNATLMGFSQGAYAAFSIARNAPGDWSRLLLIAAKVYPNAKHLRRHGVERVLFAAGDYDMTHGPMWTAARRLERGGYPARFMSLGKVGHTFPDDMTKRMSDAVTWLGL